MLKNLRSLSSTRTFVSSVEIKILSPVMNAATDFKRYRPEECMSICTFNKTNLEKVQY